MKHASGRLWQVRVTLSLLLVQGELGIISLDGCIGFGIGAKRVRLEKNESGIIEPCSDVNVDTQPTTDGSDQRIKKDLFTADIDSIHRRLRRMGSRHMVMLTWCSMHACNAKPLVHGLIAQELRNVFPEHVDVRPRAPYPIRTWEMRDFHRINTLSLALDSIAAFRHRLDDIESKWEAVAPLRTCGVRSDNLTHSGDLSVETGCASRCVVWWHTLSCWRCCKWNTWRQH